MIDTNDILYADSVARECISNKINENFFVEASAGSGKTTALVKRMTAMVEAGTDVSKICAITFTKAAAGEFYSRFQKSLAKRSIEGETEEIRSRCADALMNIDLCFMGTIDSFCNMIISEHPTEAGIPSGASVMSDDDADKVYRKEYSRIVRGAYGKELQRKAALFCAFFSKPDSVFINVLKNVIECRNSDIVYPKPDFTDIDSFFKDDIRKLLETLRRLINHPEITYIPTRGDSEKFVRQLDELSIKFHKLEDSWNDNLNDILYILKSFNGYRTMCDPVEIGIMDDLLFEPHITRGKVSWYTLNLDTTGSVYSLILAMKYSITMDFVVSSAYAVASELKKKGCLTYFDYLMYLRDMLKNDAQKDGVLISHIRKRHSFYLIDEFQDTNPLQTEIFFYLAAEKPYSDWRKCIPRPGSLFIVGDPKQSIYRFRSADVASFINVREMFSGEVGSVIRLSRNFRSSNLMCSWFNDVFSALLPHDTKYQSSFQSIPVSDCSESNDTFGGVYSYTVLTGKHVNADSTDPEKVVQIIKRLVNNPEYLIQDRSDAAPRQIRYSDFMVITPKKTRLGNYTKVFNKHKIPVRLEGNVVFSECHALTAVAEIMSAVAFPSDSMRLYGALKSLLFNICDTELSALRNNGLRLSLIADNAEIIKNNPSVKYAFESLTKLAKEAKNLTASSVFCKISDELRVIARTGAYSLEYFYFALELLRSAEITGQVSSVGEGADFLRGLIENSGEERCISLQRNDNRIHVANLHKVKGLEAPIVILADPQMRIQPPEKRIAHGSDNATCHIFRVNEGVFPILSTDLYQSEKEEEECCLSAERDRLLYVAATRAKCAVIIADARDESNVRKNDNPWNFLLGRTDGDFFEIVNKGVVYEAQPPVQVNADELFSNADSDCVFNGSCSAEPSYTLLKPSELKIKEKIAEEDLSDDNENNQPVSEKRYNAALIGTMIHKLMEILVSSRKSYAPEQIAKQIMSQYGCESSFIKNLVEKAAAQIQNGGYAQKNSLPSDILTELLSADEVHCEVPFCYKKENQDNGFTLWHGVMDVVYLKNGKWHIVDYKTNLDGDALDMKYSEQLSAYKDAFLNISGESADAFIYHIEL